MIASETSTITDEEKQVKIQELREIIANAQETISSATQLLTTLQDVPPEEIPINHTDSTQEDDGQFIYGFFDGQIMIGDDGKQYPVPANYASKSKLVEGDKLKLTITTDNKFVYKQIGPVPRNYLIGIVKKDERGNFTVQTPEKTYKVLLAAATYFKIEPNDEVTLIIPQEKATVWGAIENVLQKNVNPDMEINQTVSNQQPEFATTLNTNSTKKNTTPKNDLTAIEKLEKEIAKEKTVPEITTNDISTEAIINEWEPDIEHLKQQQEAELAINSSK